MSFIVILLVFSLVRFIYRKDSQNESKRTRQTVILATIVIMLSLLLLLVNSQIIFTKTTIQNNVTVYLEEETEPDASVLFINSGVEPSFPNLIVTNRENANSYIMANPIVFEADTYDSTEDFYSNSLERVPSQIASYLDTIAEDITSKQPEIIGISTSCDFCDNSLDIHDYLVTIGFVDEAILPTYQYDSLQDGYQIYRFVGDNNASP
jgi:hypothetical protein